MVRPTLHSGMNLVEIVVGSAIVTVAFVAILSAYAAYLSLAFKNTKTIQATLLIEETVEALKFLRDKGWSTEIALRTSGTSYYLSWSGTSWQITTTNAFVDGVFERKFTFSDVLRNVSGDIALSGSADSGTKKVTVTVSWQNGAATSSRTLSFYLHDLQAN